MCLLLPARIIASGEAVSELNKRKVGLFIEAVWNEGRLELIDELVAADYTGCFSRLQPRVLGPEGVRELVSSRRHAYPGLYVKVEDQIAEADRVVTRWQAATRMPGDHAGASIECVRCCSGISIVRAAGDPEPLAAGGGDGDAAAPAPEAPYDWISPWRLHDEHRRWARDRVLVARIGRGEGFEPRAQSGRGARDRRCRVGGRVPVGDPPRRAPEAVPATEGGQGAQQASRQAVADALFGEGIGTRRVRGRRGGELSSPRSGRRVRS